MSGTSRSNGTPKDLEKEARGLLHVSMERTLKFDIFSGTIDKNAFWLERVGGLEKAKRRTVVAQIDASSEIPCQGKGVRLSEVGSPRELLVVGAVSQRRDLHR